MADEPEVMAPEELEPGEDGVPAIANEVLGRDRDLLGRRTTSPIRKKLLEIFEQVRNGFENQAERADDIEDYWRCYYCEPDSNAFYNGDAQIYVPIVRDAVNARMTRFSNQLFPQFGRAVEAIDADGTQANQLVALLDHYIHSAQFRTQVAKPLIRNGDIEGQYNLCVDWDEIKRQIVSRETHGPLDPQTGAEMPGPEIMDITEEEIVEGFPGFEVLHDPDVLIFPFTAKGVESALQTGGHVSIVRRWSKEKIRKLIADGMIREDEGDDLMEEMGKVSQADTDLPKLINEAVGIIKKGREATVWETWVMLPLNEKGYSEKDGDVRLCRVFFGPGQKLLGAKRNPFWNDRCPLLSVPVEKVVGSAKGQSLVAPIASLQYEANDAANEGADAAARSAMPIILRDPDKGNGPLILNLGAIWDYPKDGIQFMTFPDLTPRAMTRIQFCTQAIFQSLGVNPAMLPQQTSTAKRNQAQVAQEQQVDLLTTAEAVTVLEEGIFSPVCGWIVDLDYQFRTEEMSIAMWGEMGRQAYMQRVGPLQNRRGFRFVWRGGEMARQNAMMMQQGTGWLNVLRGLRQELQQEGMQLRLGPIVEAGTSNIFGPMLAGKTIIDIRDQITLDTGSEIEMMLDGFETWPHPMDQDEQKINEFRQAMMATGDPHGTIRARMQRQLMQRNAKVQQQMMQQAMQAQQGQPGQGRPPGMPQQGGQPAGRPRIMKPPPGAIHRDQMPRAGAVPMPRKM